ncbi:MAG TPA: hypothetical protein VGQ65_12145 [Thermoanaerobaculia bacterium]|nr:hypothetical protein [Thermoanaerobaculia bacterium]
MQLLTHELTHVLEQRNVVQLQAAGQPVPMTSFPTRAARDFVPGHPFYELLAHEIAYHSEFDSCFLYRAQQSFKEQPAANVFESLERPQAVGDHYAILRTLPKPDEQGSGLYYEMQKIEHAKTGFFAYALIPTKSTVPRILVFRGTEPKSKLDLKADLDPPGVGNAVFKANELLIAAQLTAMKTQPGNATVITGHSLGGALAQWTSVTFPELVKETVTFNSPGITFAAAKQFAEAKKKPKVSHYVTRGDLVSSAGEAHIDGTTTVLEGEASRELLRMIESNDIALADDTLNDLSTPVDILASPFTVGIPEKAEYVLLFWALHRRGIEALRDLGSILGKLHSERLLRSSGVPPSAFGLPGGQSPLEFPADAATLALETGSVSVKTSPKSVTVPKVETVRKNLGMSKIVMGGLDTIFDAIIPFVDKISKTPSEAIAAEVAEFNSPIRKLARQVQPTLHAIVPQLTSAGGLDTVFRLVLDYHYEKPKHDDRDATKYVPSIQPWQRR